MNKKILFGVLLGAPLLFASNIDKCTSCHGTHFEKSAFGKSKIVKDMPLEDIRKSLEGYKNKKFVYGGSFKKIMEDQVKDLDINKTMEEIEKRISL